MHPVVRFLAAGAVAAVSLSCADQSVGLRRGTSLASLPIAPLFATSASGGPKIDIEKIRGVLTQANGTDSSEAVAPVDGDSAILEFENVAVTGDETKYNLAVQAFDANNIVVFEGAQEVTVKPGDNAPASPTLTYSAPDATAAAIDIRAGGASASTVELQWAGATPGNTSCLSRVPNPSAITQIQLSVQGTDAANQPVPDVRVGWTSLDETVATVDENGLVRARCSNKSTKIVARTFLDVVDEITVNVTAPPFALLMTPETADLERGKQLQMSAVLVDENGNSAPASQVSWHSSDELRAPITANGLVTGLRNGRVVITASAGDRTTVGVIQVVRPTAASVTVIPQTDTIEPGQFRRFFARAFDAQGNVIGDATEVQWSSDNTVAATVDAAGFVLGKQLGIANIKATIDGKTDAGALTVKDLPPGTIQGVVKDGSTDMPLAGATIGIPGGTSTVSAGDGSYTLGGVSAGDNISISKDGYVTVTFFDAPAFPDQTIRVPNVPLPPTSSLQGTMLGKVTNALTGSGVSGLTVKAYAGVNAAPSVRRPDAQPVATATTSSDGTFSMQAPAGAYTFVVTGTGYGEAVGVGISVGGSTKTAPVILLPPAVTGGGLYVVLTWGTCGATGVPCDLDAHVTGPTASGSTTRFQVHSGNRAFVVGVDTVAALDVVDATGPGPEVASIRPASPPGIYRFYVKDMSNATDAASLALANTAGARVDLFLENRVIATFFPPMNQQGTLWEVFRYDGARIFPVGVITQPTDPTTLSSRMGEPPLVRAGRPIRIRP